MNESKLDVKKRAVIEIAENLFLSQGLATTEMKEIARCASISRSTLYRMFDSRETLAFAVADKCLHELFDPKPMEIYGTDRSGFEILRSYSSNLIETMIQGVRYVKYLSEFDQMFSGDYPDTPEARKYVQFNRQRHDRQILLNILRLGTEDGSIRGDIDAKYAGTYHRQYAPWRRAANPPTGKKLPAGIRLWAGNPLQCHGTDAGRRAQ